MGTGLLTCALRAGGREDPAPTHRGQQPASRAGRAPVWAGEQVPRQPAWGRLSGSFPSGFHFLLSWTHEGPESVAHPPGPQPSLGAGRWGGGGRGWGDWGREGGSCPRLRGGFLTLSFASPSAWLWVVLCPFPGARDQMEAGGMGLPCVRAENRRSRQRGGRPRPLPPAPRPERTEAAAL